MTLDEKINLEIHKKYVIHDLKHTAFQYNIPFADVYILFLNTFNKYQTRETYNLGRWTNNIEDIKISKHTLKVLKRYFRRYNDDLRN